MDLEKRVEMLEQEVQLLKNQIQATLLDIQEQILTNAYPSLRAEDAPAPPPPPAAPINTVSVNPAAQPHQPTPEPEPGGPVNVRKVSLNDLNDQPQNGHAPHGTSPTLPAAPDDTDWANLDEMESWVSKKVEKMGTRRTRELIHMYTERGRFDEDMAQALLQFVELYDEDRWNSTPTKTPKASAPPRSARQQQSTPAKPRAKTKTKAQAQSQAQARPKPARSAPKPPPAPHDEHTEEVLEESQPRNTVLRLIAGIYNAGAGITPDKSKSRK